MKIFNGLAAEGAFVEELQREVDRVKLSEEWRREYMTLQVLLDDTNKEAYMEGLVEGRADGRAEGRTESLVQMVCKKTTKRKIGFSDGRGIGNARRYDSSNCGDCETM